MKLLTEQKARIYDYVYKIINDKSIKIDIILTEKHNIQEKNVHIENKTMKRKLVHNTQREEDIHKIHKSWSDKDYEYYKSLSKKKRQKIDDIEYNISLINSDHIPLRFKIITSKMSDSVKSIAINKLLRLKNNADGKMVNYLQHLTSLPLGIYNLPKILDRSPNEYFDDLQKKLDTFIYGHEKAKSQIIRLLAKWIVNPEGKGLIIGLEGSPGTGKTQLGLCLSDVFSLPYQFIPLGGCSDSHFLTGHNYTYEGSQYGKIADCLIQAKSMNPIFYFDELDKVSDTKHGYEIINALIHITDNTQNDKFRDKYFSEIDLDLSKSLILFSFNDSSLINPILRDRINTIKINDYTLKDKINIAQKYMIPNISKDFNFQANDIIFSDDIITYIISFTDDEKGVRKMKFMIQEIISQINFHKLLNKMIIDNISFSTPFQVTKNIIDKYIFQEKKNNESWRYLYL